MTVLEPKTYASQAKVNSNPSPSPDSANAILKTLSIELDKIAPRFDVNASDITILDSPGAFYELLKDKIRNAKSHIFLSTLYIGKDETELINTIRQSLKQRQHLTVSILADALRGTRENPGPSCSSLILSLVKEFPGRVECYMYHTPNLVGWRRRLIPKRINEGWGLQHMKLYGIDDEIILSGANLSSDYFTNRQDRYHLISSRPVTRYYRRLYSEICKLSLRLLPNERKLDGMELVWFSENGPSAVDNPKAYIEAATERLRPFLRPSAKSTASRSDTSVYPLFQLTPIIAPDRSTELPALKLALESLSSDSFRGSKWMFTAGYFNMTTDVRDLLLAATSTRGTVLAASPWANGFYGSKGVSGMLPAAYTYLARQFLASVDRSGLSDRIKLKEWRFGTVNTPGGWTYHAKGLWMTLPGDEDPSVTLVGSSNYTKRSYSLDLEANAMILTSNPDLKKRLGQEQIWLQEHAREVNQSDFEKTDRRVGLHVRLAMWITTLVGGAL